MPGQVRAMRSKSLTTTSCATWVAGVMLASGVCVAGGLEGSTVAVPVSDQAADRFYSSVSAPETLPQLLKLLVAVARSGVFSRWDFYTAGTMKRLFGDHVIPTVLDDGIVTSISAHGYLNLVAAPDASTRRAPYLSGIWIEASKPNANGWPFCCRFDAEFWGEIPGLDFRRVTQLLGAGWKEDLRAEAEVAVSRAEPFNPPVPATGYMANAIIRYDSDPAERIVLVFDPAGRLHDFHAEWAKMQAQQKR